MGPLLRVRLPAHPHEYHDGSVTATAVKHGRKEGKIFWEEQSGHPV